MSEKTFLVCGNTVFGTGHSIDNKTVVIEVEVDDNGRFASVIAPQAFADRWPIVKVSGSMEAWVECDGPARLLTDDEWRALLKSKGKDERQEYARK